MLMSKIKALEELIKKSGGVITANMVDENNIHREYLSELIKQGKLERVSYGVYITPDVWEDKMLIHQLRKKKMIYSHETALFMNDLTDREPMVYSVTVPFGYNDSRLKKEGLIVHTVKKELFELGAIIKKTAFGNDVKVYGAERSICDLIRDRNNQDQAIITDALKKYVIRKDKDLNKLITFAGKFRVEKILKNYLEVLL
jgi:predicted transcriptional regulator of viral defense system